ncbi:Long-chain-fatty-acid--CoA ligase [compost metagenome]
MLLHGGMMTQPLLISSIITHAARNSGSHEVVSQLSDGSLHRYTYADCEQRTKQLAGALLGLGITQGDRVATLAWNGYRHLEIYYGVSGLGAVCHTINPRLHLQQIVYIINHAQDVAVCYDIGFAALIDQIAEQCPSVRHWIALTDIDHAENALSYEALLRQACALEHWPEFDENTASSLCYTSGTTGQPKGVLYSHRSTLLQAYAASHPDAMGISAHDVVLPLVPMFHVNAWGLPYTALMAGSKLVLPGSRLDGASLQALCDGEGVTFSAGVPSVWQGYIETLQARGQRPRTLRRAYIGGSACPPAMFSALHELGVDVTHSWGMTEVSPLGTACRLLPKHDGEDNQTKIQVLAKQGRELFGIEMRTVDEAGIAQPRNGQHPGNLMVRGNWVVRDYYQSDSTASTEGWFDTGDMATIDEDGYLLITDRCKDVIKSGGEWISSIDLENIAMAHPKIHMAACIACDHQRWGERPLLVAVAKPGARVDAADLLAFFESKVAKWCIPDDVLFIEDMPLTATGKLFKLALRERYRDHYSRQSSTGGDTQNPPLIQAKA